MKKEEFPTFLNEQPTVVFGRTARELLVFVAGVLLGYVVWSSMADLVPGPAWMVFTGIMTAVPIVISVIVALFPVAQRPLEEWFLVLLFYVAVPKVYLYKPIEDTEISYAETHREQGEQKISRRTVDEDLLDI